jgi:ribosomal RNA assembly protein
LYVDSKSGEVVVDTEDSLTQFILANVIAAVNMGHSPDSAMRLEDETFVLDTIDVKSYVKDHTRLKVVMGRIIGKEGSTRKLIEEITKCSVSVKDHYVSVIGPYENTILVHEALDMLIKGASHKSLYSYLERNKVNINTGLL